MSVLDELATALGRRDEGPNQELARKIVQERDRPAVQELVENLAHKNKGIQNDCIKALYEIGEADPNLIAKYYKEFGKLLESKNNRLVWGAMMALDTIALKEPKAVYGMLSKILRVADTSGSVIAKDHAVGIFAKLGTLRPYKRDCVALLIEQLMSCPNNQFTMYVEMSFPVIDAGNRKRLGCAVATRARLTETKARQRVATETRRKGS